MFGFGLIADVGGTVLLCVAASARWTWTLHTVSGLASLLIMALHFVWAVLATSKEGNWKSYFDRFSVYAWCSGWCFIPVFSLSEPSRFVENAFTEEWPITGRGIVCRTLRSSIGKDQRTIPV